MNASELINATAPNSQETVDRLGLTIKAEFVPFSRSRNAGEKNPSLNWKITLSRNPGGGAQMHGAPLNATAPSRSILTTDYSAGAGHCPAHQASVKRLGSANSILRAEHIAWECENGRTSRLSEHFGPSGSAPILPNTLDVIHSLVMDSDVLDESSFEDWANSTGYDPDSRSAETIYRACLAIALQLRNGLGEKALEDLRNAFQDY